MPEQIALLELPLIDASDRKSLTMVSQLGEGKVLGRPAKFQLTVNGSRIEIWVEKRVFTISVNDLLERSVAAIEAELKARITERALAVHGTPPYPPAAKAARALFGAREDEA